MRMGWLTNRRGGLPALFLLGAATSLPSAAAAQDSAAPASAPLASAPSIEWWVDRRFRLWSEAPDAGPPVEELLDTIAASGDSAAIHDAIVAFLDEHRGLHRSAFWSDSTRAYPLRYFYPADYRVRMRLRGAAGLAGRRCVWTSSAGQIGGGGESVDCAAEVELVLASAADHAGSVPASVQVAVEGQSAPASAQVAVRDRLIVSLGDSFASGEGNPDRPADLAALRSGLPAGTDADTGRHWLGRKSRNAIGPASWLDTTCHRSFFNQHMVAALRHAASRPHEATTFASYACTGAAIFGGLLTEQATPPGYYDDVRLPPQEVAQVEAMVRDLCPAVPGGGEGWRRLRRDYRQTDAGGGTKLVSTSNGYACAAPGSRRIDAVLLAIGGNDAGFARVVMELLLPPADWWNLTYGVARKILVLPLDRSGRLIADALRPNLALVRGRLREIDPRIPIVQSAYPSPARDAASALCGPPDQGAADARRHSSVGRLRGLDGLWFTGLDPRAPPIVDQREGRAVQSTVIDLLNRTILQEHSSGWQVVDGFLPEFDRHGWCVGGGTAETADLPVWDRARGWLGWNPADWNPYARRGRHFRTPTDSALTLAPIRPRVEFLGVKFDEIARMGLLVSLAGSIHPTFEAHVIMGLAVAERLAAQLPAEP